MKKTILICGSLEQPLSPERWHLLKAIIKVLVGSEYVIGNTNGKLLGQYVTLAVMEACVAKGVMSNDFLIQHVPPQRDFVASLQPSISFESLLHYHRVMMIGVKHPSIALFIGGDKGTNIEYNLCKEHDVPYLGLPYFGGTGKDVFDKVQARVGLIPFAQWNVDMITIALQEMKDERPLVELMVLQAINHIIPC